jgi:hypothetical protein
VAQAEKGADGDGALAGGDEAAGGQVDGGDVVCVEGVAEAEGARLVGVGLVRGREMEQ